MEKTTKDPVKLQQLLSSLTCYNKQYESATQRWKIRDEYAPFNDQQGNPILAVSRVPYVPDILEAQYRMLVEQRNMPLRQIDSRVLDICVKFLTDPRSRTCLLLYGTPGTGKTTFMRAMWMTVGFMYREEIAKKEMSNKYVKASELGAVLKGDKDEYKAIKGATCLFIDDLGFNGESELVNDYGVKARPVEDIIEHRYDRQLLTVCTTNLTAGEIRERYGERIYSRICETFGMVGVAGMDYRQARNGKQ